MKKIILILTTTLSLIFPTVTFADGNDLLKKCLVAERYLDTNKIDAVNFKTGLSIGNCLGLIQGVRNTMQLVGDPAHNVCFPKNGIDNGQAMRIVISYLKQSPANLHENEVYLTIRAYMSAYPCK